MDPRSRAHRPDTLRRRPGARTFTPWRGRFAGTTLSRRSAGIVPYLIEYDPAIDLDAIFEEKHRVAGHLVEVGAIGRIETDGTRIVAVSVSIDGDDVPLPLG